MQTVVYTLSIVIQAIMYSLIIYHFAVSLFAWLPRKEREVKVDKKHTFALFVAAHNEQQVIGNMVESLKAINYDKDKYDIFVIADNCTDNTAKIAREAGANVLERTNETERGKGYAMDWAFRTVFEGEREYDAFCVFDADNIAHEEFLNEINKRLCQGYEAVQGYVETKNPYDTWITAAYAMTFTCINKLYQTARYNIGLPNQLNGTGFAVKTSILKEYTWGAKCLAEDMEYTMELMTHNVLVGWNDKAIVYDEKPLTLSQSWKQRVRWMQGHSDVASRYVPKLLKKLFVDKDIRCFDCMVYLVQPLMMVTMAVTLVMGFVQGLFPDVKLWFMPYEVMPDLVWNVFFFAQLCYTPLILWLEKKLTTKSILYYIPYLVFTYTWLPIAFIGIAKKNQKEWFHTQHTRTISINEVK